jgi:hypothetical protein
MGVPDRKTNSLILKRMPTAASAEQYEVVCDGRHVGRIYLASPHDKHGVNWYWGVAFFERPKASAHLTNKWDGFAASRDKAMAAFRAAWDRIAQ